MLLIYVWLLTLCKSRDKSPRTVPQFWIVLQRKRISSLKWRTWDVMVDRTGRLLFLNFPFVVDVLNLEFLQVLQALFKLFSNFLSQILEKVSGQYRQSVLWIMCVLSCISKLHWVIKSRFPSLLVASPLYSHKSWS